MKLRTILDKVELRSIALPVFQRGYVWKRQQVRNFFSSLYRRNPVGSLLVWETTSEGANVRGTVDPRAGNIQLLLDGQQRITSAYGVILGNPPAFFEGDAQAFTGLRFHVDEERFEFFQQSKMALDPLWVDVSKLMNDGLGRYISLMHSLDATDAEHRLSRLSTLQQVRDIEIHIEEITGKGRSADEVVDIFNVVNSSGTQLSKGDLALAKIGAHWPEARTEMKEHLAHWAKAGYYFSLDWLLRCLNTVLNGRAEFRHLHGAAPTEIRDGLRRAVKAIDSSLNLIAGKLGLDHDRVLFGRYAIPVMARYFDRNSTSPDSNDRDQLLFWYLQAAMWGRFSGSTETAIDQDLEAIGRGGLDRLLEQMRLWHGSLRVEAAHFDGWRISHRFYPILYFLTRMGEAQNLCDGLALKKGLLGARQRLEVHHIFPKAQLRKSGYTRHSDVNSLANLCFLTKECNQRIAAHLPQDYFAHIKRSQPGALESQWIPMDERLWRIENYHEFLEARRQLLAIETNKRLAELLHDNTRWIEDTMPRPETSTTRVLGGSASEEEERKLLDLRAWVAERGLAPGVLPFDFSDPETGEQKAVFDLAWPDGIQTGLTQPVAVLLDAEGELLRFANDIGYRFFTSISAFRRYVETEILGGGEPTSEDAPGAGQNG